MNDSETTAACQPIPWNKGKLISQKPPLKIREIWALRTPLESEGKRTVRKRPLVIGSGRLHRRYPLI